MPQYVVNITGPDGGQGTITVNASSPQAAMQNATQGGNTALSLAGSSGGSSAPSSTSGGNNPSPASGGGQQTYNTINGPKTLHDMQSELGQAGYNGPTDPQSIINTYAHTAGGTVTLAPPGNDVTYTNTDQAQRDITNAQNAAYQAYLSSKLNLETDDLAFKKAQQAFSESLSTAQMTGLFNGQPTLPAMTSYANQFGQWGVPQPGQQTLAAQGQYFNQGLALQTQNQKVVQDYLTLLSNLRGPQDYGQYLRVMASTPQGLQSLVGAAAGNMGRAPAFGVTGAPTTPATLGGFMGQAASGGTAPGGTSYADYQNAVSGLVAPSQIAPQAWNSMTNSQKQILLGMYEAAGWNVTDALQQYQASLPKFGSSTPQPGNVRLV